MLIALAKENNPEATLSSVKAGPIAGGAKAADAPKPKPAPAEPKPAPGKVNPNPFAKKEEDKKEEAKVPAAKVAPPQ